MSGLDCIDICDSVLELMCGNCPNYDACQNCDEDANHHQMLICMGNLRMKDNKYPDDFEPYYTDEDMLEVVKECQRIDDILGD